MNDLSKYFLPMALLIFAGILLVNLFDSPDYEKVREPVESEPVTAKEVVGMPVAMTAPMTTNPTVPSYISPTIQLAEGHWQGMETIPLSVEIKKKLNIPLSMEGVLIDEVTLSSFESGVVAGDILVAIARNKVRTIEDVERLSKQVRESSSVLLTVVRKNRTLEFVLKSKDILGFSQSETAPMILPSDIMPHPYRGECVSCHPIGTIGHITPDPDGIPLPVPTIRVGAVSPHRDRGPCEACHVIIANKQTLR
ncbi:MAG: magnetochrome domain-containing protein [SAR324 cluster bacterium]|nr:magnetochrome domain-containing protein [SAR324 cluster bacterium]